MKVLVTHPLCNHLFKVRLIFGMLLFGGGSLLSQCLVEGSTIQYTPNPSSTVLDNGIQYIKLYIHVCERFESDPTLSDSEVDAIVQEANTDFSAAKIHFLYCLERNYNPDMQSNDQFGENDLLSSFGHDDGIDVFLMPKEYYYVKDYSSANQGGGIAYTIDSPPYFGAVPAQEIMIFGKTTACEFPFFPENIRFCQVPHALSHELGHCLGLFHTHETFFCVEPPTGGDCANCGDRICDTNPSANLKYCVDQNCNWVSHSYPSNCAGDYVPDHSYHPDLNNIMAYTNYFACSPVFTGGHNTRMMETLQNNPLLQNFRYKYHSGDLTITGTEAWPLSSFPPSGNIWVDGNLTVSNGAELTINAGANVYFPETGKLIVEKGAKVNLYGKITAACDYWQGALVDGTPTIQQAATHGWLETYAGSKIENAKIGAVSVNGGIIRATGTTFKNNMFGSEVRPYQLNNATGLLGISYDQCHFYTDHRVSRFGEPVQKRPKAHLRFLSVNSFPFIYVRGCIFENTPSFIASAFSQRPTDFGIYSVSSDFLVTTSGNVKCQFSDLNIGIFRDV